MAKAGKAGDEAVQSLRTLSAHRGFTLCVGAGTSLNANGARPHPFPLWGELVDGLLARCDARLLGRGAPASLRGFGYDAIIQAAANRLAATDGGRADDGGVAFATVLADELYAGLRAALPADAWPVVARCLEARKPGDVPRDVWLRFRALLEGAFPSLTALGLADALVERAESRRLPVAVLSFNAEPLLLALLNANIARVSTAGSGGVRFDRVTEAVASRDRSRIPYYFCHGLLPVPGGTAPERASVDKLVFSESDYLSLANTSFAWQSSVFLNACATTSVLFVGLSMTDPNMRRWLAWVHHNRVEELRRKGASADSTAHFWIHRRPASVEEQEWTELAMAHLGVRLVWIDAWTELAPLVQRVLGP